MRAAGAAVALLVAGAVVAGAAVGVTAAGDGHVAGVDVTPWSDPRPEDPCLALADLVDSLDLATVGDQASLHARGAALAAALLAAGEAAGPAGADEADASARLAGRRILAVLDRPGAAVSELLEVLAPVAERCAISLPTAVPGA